MSCRGISSLRSKSLISVVRVNKKMKKIPLLYFILASLCTSFLMYMSCSVIMEWELYKTGNFEYGRRVRYFHESAWFQYYTALALLITSLVSIHFIEKEKIKTVSTYISFILLVIWILNFIIIKQIPNIYFGKL
jgi:hypothetical protein